jgi:hypothetical protein
MSAPRGSENGNRYSPTGREVLTHSGVMIDVTAPRAEQIRLCDVARSLAHQERFTGHSPLSPSIAAHSLAVEWCVRSLMPERFGGRFPFERLDELETVCRAALFHDAGEMVVSDLNGATKKLIRPHVYDFAGGRRAESAFDKLESLAMLAVAERFDFTGLSDEWAGVIHEADCLACAYEMAWQGWCTDAKPPAWVRDSPYLHSVYALPDGGQSAFEIRARALGVTGP